MKGAESAQKALQGYKTKMRELLGGINKNSVLPEDVFYTKSQLEKFS